jgi:hypothetical protein
MSGASWNCTSWCVELNEENLLIIAELPRSCQTVGFRVVLDRCWLGQSLITDVSRQKDWQPWVKHMLTLFLTNTTGKMRSQLVDGRRWSPLATELMEM